MCFFFYRSNINIQQSYYKYNFLQSKFYRQKKMTSRMHPSENKLMSSLDLASSVRTRMSSWVVSDATVKQEDVSNCAEVLRRSDLFKHLRLVDGVQREK